LPNSAQRILNECGIIQMIMKLTGLSFIGGRRGSRQGKTFEATNPQTSTALELSFFSATPAEIDEAVQSASAAFATYSRTNGKVKAAFLRRAADSFDAHNEELGEQAHLETALPVPRLLGEVTRTANQLRLFASVVEEGSWVNARIDPALPDRKPQPRPDIRSMLRPLGPVVVFGASNFPLAFSVAGGDTASALAAGCPVIVKAHPAHPATSEIAAQILTDAVSAEGLHPGVFSLIFDAGIEASSALVKHLLVRAVAFTGSLRAGRTLMDLAAARPDPIPCFTEMSSGNPVFILPGALRKGAAAVAKNLFGSVTLGAGQFCTKPGIVMMPDTPQSSDFERELSEQVHRSESFQLLTTGIAHEYARGTKARESQVALVASASESNSPSAFSATARLFKSSVDDLLANPSLADEIFGPDTLLVQCREPEDFLRVAAALDGHLTATILGDDEDLATHRELIQILEQKAGRLIFNGFPTGVEVTHAMVHGGPYPSTSDPRFTSVGSLAIYRFARPVCFQGFPEAMLPPELQDANPLGIRRLRNGKPETL
jgi:2,5-dioxopentanoate dehydrogenase